MPVLFRHRGLPALIAGDRSALEIDVRMRGDEVVVARTPEELVTAPRLLDVLLSTSATAAVEGWFVDVKEADALAPTVAMFADVFESDPVGVPCVFVKLPRYAEHPRWATPAALHRAPKMAVFQCDVSADTALNQDPAAKGYAYWDDFNGSGWRTADMLRRARLAGLRVILCSDEVYGRPCDVAKLAVEWRGAYGVLTDTPEVWTRVLREVSA